MYICSMTTLHNIQKLSTAERIIMIEKIWDTIEPDNIKLTTSQKKELDKRLERYRRGETKFYNWEDLKVQLISRKG